MEFAAFDCKENGVLIHSKLLSILLVTFNATQDKMNLNKNLKAALWQRYGSAAHPAEWDGKVYGGGKLSQRFWEYHQTIELLELTPDSVVLDIGGGSPITGAGFFTQLIAPFVRQVHVMDVNIGGKDKLPSNVIFHQNLANYENLSKILHDNPQVTHVACISVFEHIPDEVRRGMVKAVNEAFMGDIFVATLEYHSQRCFFEYQLTTQTTSELFEPLVNFYPDVIQKSPFWCTNAFSSLNLVLRILMKIKKPDNGSVVPGLRIPLWYPVAFRFCRIV